MKKGNIIWVVLILVSMNFVLAMGDNLYYNVEVSYDNGEIGIKGVDVEFSNKELIDYGSGDYSLRILEVDGTVKKEIEFSVRNTLIREGFDEDGEKIGEIIELDESDFNVYVPYNGKAEEIVIYDNRDNEVARKDVSEFSKVVVEKLSEEGKKEIERTLEGEEKSMFWVFLIVGIVVLVAVLFLVFRKKK